MKNIFGPLQVTIEEQSINCVFKNFFDLGISNRLGILTALIPFHMCGQDVLKEYGNSLHHRTPVDIFLSAELKL